MYGLKLLLRLLMDKKSCWKNSMSQRASVQSSMCEHLCSHQCQSRVHCNIAFLSPLTIQITAGRSNVLISAAYLIQMITDYKGS